jgi:transposase InsO family protein
MNERIEQRPTRREVLPYNGIRANNQPLCPEFWIRLNNDHGAQYTSKDYATLCDQLGITLFLGGVGTSADNALAESFNATLKRETLAGAATFTGRGDVPPRGLPLGHPLQHQKAPLLSRPPEHLRKPTHGYHPGSRVIAHTPCPKSRGKPLWR